MILHDDAVYPLFSAIVKRAAVDYATACKHGEFGSVSFTELERFFHGPLFTAGCGDIDPDALLRDIRRGKTKIKASLNNMLGFKPKEFYKERYQKRKETAGL